MTARAKDTASPANVSDRRPHPPGPARPAGRTPCAPPAVGGSSSQPGCAAGRSGAVSADCRRASGGPGRSAGTACAGAADRVPGVPVAAEHASHREYARWRARQIAYGRWEPWADAAPVREHVGRLRRRGASYQAIAQAAGVSAMTVHRLLRGCPSKGQPVPGRIGAAQARRLLAFAAAEPRAGRRSSCGSRRRLQALVAIGHSPAALARGLDVSPQWVRRMLRGETRTVSPGMSGRVRGLYDRMWDGLPPERTRRERGLARAARHRAEAEGWPPPMGLDDDRIDDSDYRTRIAWGRATGIVTTALPGRPARSVPL